MTCLPPSLLKMTVKNNTYVDVESTAHGQRAPSELDPLLRHDTPVPTKKQSRLAFLQFLAFCSALFMLGWADGSTGPLLPTINHFYGVGYPTHVFVRFVYPQNLQIGFGTVSWIFASTCAVSDIFIANRCRVASQKSSGNGCGSIAEYASSRRTWFGKRELLTNNLLLTSVSNFNLSGGRIGVYLTDFIVFRRISSTRLSPFRYILFLRWGWNGSSGWCSTHKEVIRIASAILAD